MNWTELQFSSWSEQRIGIGLYMCSETTEHQPSYSFAAANSVVALTRMLNECEVKLGRLAAGQFS